jgi:hypothetical protein
VAVLAGAITDPADFTRTLRAAGVWTAYTPEWTSSGTQPALVNGTLTGRYLVVHHQLVKAQIRLVMGGSTTFGTGVYFFSLPFPASTDSAASFNAAGTAWALDTGTKESGGVCKLESGGTTFRISAAPAASGASDNWGQTGPFTWATTDVLTAWVDFEPA